MAESKPGMGSTFTIFLPCTVFKPAGTRKEVDPVRGGTERILMVDDEPELLDMTGQMLQGLGYRVTLSQTGQDALKAFLKNPSAFDLVITDQTMPGITGVDLAKRILATRKEVPIILLTGFSEMVSAESAKASGLSAFLMKPLSKRHLASAVRQLLDGRKEKVSKTASARK